MEYRSAFKRYLATGDETEIRAMGESGASNGAYLYPPEFQAELAVSLKQYGVLFSDYTVVDTDHGRPLEVPTAQPATAGQLVGENPTTAPTENDRTFGQVTLNAWLVHSGVQKVSFALDQDTGIPMESVFAQFAGEAVGRELSALAVSGTGTSGSQPQGIYAATTAGQTVSLTAAQAVEVDGAASTEQGSNVLAPKTLRAMLKALDSAYWPTAAWYMNATQVTALMGVTDNSGQPLIRPNGPLCLWDIPIKVAPEITDLTASTVSGPLLGSMSHGWFFRNAGTRIQRMPQRFADAGSIGYQAHLRGDLQVRDNRAWVAVKAAAT
jgi:HK97 family phage major capsid protein